MFRVLSIDPGNDTGWAFWEDGRLVSCGLGPPAFGGVRIPIAGVPDLLIAEFPVVYPGGRSVPPNDLLVLGCTLGRQVQRVLETWDDTDRPAFGVFPRTWKGTIDKDTMCRRIQTMIGPINQARAVECMDTTNVPAGKRHNVWDGVGLGHWAIVQAMTGAKLGKDPVTAIMHMSDYVFRAL